MKSIEEIKAEITNNSYPVELSNGQTIYVDRITSSKVITAYIRDEKNPYGFRKVVSVSRKLDRENAIEDIKEYIENIIMPSLIKFETVSAYNQAYSSLIEEIADAILNEPVVEDIIAEVETGEVYSRFEEEIKEMKRLDAELYNSYITRVYNRKKADQDFDILPTSDFSLTHHNIIYLVNKLSKKYNIDDIRKKIEAKWNYDPEHFEEVSVTSKKRGKVITDREELLVCKQYKDGWAIRKIAAYANISQTTVMAILKRRDIVLRKGKQITSDQERQVINLYQSGEPIREIKNKTGIKSEQTIYRILGDAKINKRRKG